MAAKLLLTTGLVGRPRALRRCVRAASYAASQETSKPVSEAVAAVRGNEASLHLRAESGTLDPADPIFDLARRYAGLRGSGQEVPTKLRNSLQKKLDRLSHADRMLVLGEMEEHIEESLAERLRAFAPGLLNTPTNPNIRWLASVLKRIAELEAFAADPETRWYERWGAKFGVTQLRFKLALNRLPFKGKFEWCGALMFICMMLAIVKRQISFLLHVEEHGFFDRYFGYRFQGLSEGNFERGRQLLLQERKTHFQSYLDTEGRELAEFASWDDAWCLGVISQTCDLSSRVGIMVPYEDDHTLRMAEERHGISHKPKVRTLFTPFLAELDAETRAEAQGTPVAEYNIPAEALQPLTTRDRMRLLIPEPVHGILGLGPRAPEPVDSNLPSPAAA